MTCYHNMSKSALIDSPQGQKDAREAHPLEALLPAFIAANAGTVGLILTNIGASVSIVGVNKFLNVAFGFRFVLLLSAAHFFVGWLFLRLARGRLFEPKAMPWRAVLPVSIAGLLSIVVMNYSLRFNTVGASDVSATVPQQLVLIDHRNGHTNDSLIVFVGLTFGLQAVISC